ncbi:MAG: DUF1295 domain-containing protein [Calditrichaeota bacterium]|nr:DUF1295 domain-containing protein [Calditrichota bacterium]MCB0291486.1 DUF1295 domain-containing protein [Calditrichota bacterium]MCB0304178.1 DUF1295 domain-containing protein [Calditrichota bacterium]MCB0314540.1 DUF1295 domain-containing protein [Calditrichota bacterium]MCB9090024.1 DUF1295 domain-containing protein [Calditrichia bacterium]
MGFAGIYLSAGLVILLLMVLLWLLSLRLRDASIVDIFWGSGFVVCVWLYFAAAPGGLPQRQWLIVLLVTLWGLRLSLHIFRRNHGKEEDYRYQKWREENGAAWWWRSFLKVFLLQGMLMWIISVPLLAGQMAAPAINWLDAAGAVLWLFGFYFEAAGDWQLMRFKADPANRGKLFTGGVWRYTRHPNYFGDAAQWWGFYLFAAAAGEYWTVYSPLLMTFLLLRVSGVAMLERSLQDNKPGYRDYMARTNAFFPWFPRKNLP